MQLSDGRLAGHVQATVIPGSVALVAYELNSRYWRQGIGSGAVAAMLEELRAHYAVRRYVAVLKSGNYRSLGLLSRLQFEQAAEHEAVVYRDQSDELVMVQAAGVAEQAGCVSRQHKPDPATVADSANCDMVNGSYAVDSARAGRVLAACPFDDDEVVSTLAMDKTATRISVCAGTESGQTLGFFCIIPSCGSSGQLVTLRRRPADLK